MTKIGFYLAVVFAVAAASFIAVHFQTGHMHAPADDPTAPDLIRHLRAEVTKLKVNNDQLRANGDLQRREIESLKSSSSQQQWRGSRPPKTTIDLAKEEHFKRQMDEYTQLHKDIMAGTLPPRHVNCILINGWGNVIQEAISCFLFGLVSRRAIWLNTGRIRGYMPFEEFMNGDGTHLPFDGYSNKPWEKYKDGLVLPRHNLTCVDYSTLKDEMVSIIYTYDYYAPNILVNPFHGEEVLANLPTNYFQLAFVYLFKIKPELAEEVEKFKREKFGGYTVGIQIRHPSWIMSDVKNRTDHQGFPVPPLDLYAQMAEQLARFQNQVPYDEVVWFVASQKVELIQRLVDAYGPKKIVFVNATISTTFENNREGQISAFVTWWLLGECDDVITTEASSYGTVAAARSGIYPIFCTHHKFCARRMLPTPCQDTKWVGHEQPFECLKQLRKFPHQFMTAVDSSCSHFKRAIYDSKEYQAGGTWKILE
eukprot:TRINITY_DN879_c0_g2_i1.p1 TRINITY_DN879_c0_g2~~TRINITY_DN879_c0_g2_i1.p1  ORF type:complete len:480 (+),score=146.26 TRINITY_DN879_c0_g2_i1:128-1567(+)